jgi:peptidoglycan hydrolase CwlO-like protein
MSAPQASSQEAVGLADRLRAELEQAQVAIEDMNERLIELARANEELAARLREEVRLREKTELQLCQLRAETSHGKREEAEGGALRQELSVALEELQVMQEELQAAHDALSAAQPPAP